MKGRNIIIVFFPTILMTLLTVISFSNMSIYNSTAMDFKGIFIISLLLIFPVLFLIQGILCNINNFNMSNILLSFGISMLDYIILMKIYLNDSSYLYILIYPVLWMMGYAVTYFIRKIKGTI